MAARNRNLAEGRRTGSLVAWADDTDFSNMRGAPKLRLVFHGSCVQSDLLWPSIHSSQLSKRGQMPRFINLRLVRMRKESQSWYGRAVASQPAADRRETNQCRSKQLPTLSS